MAVKRQPGGDMPKKKRDTLGELERIAKSLGLKVHTDKLLFAGLKLKGGRCLLRERRWLVLDRFATYEERLEAFREAFRDLPLAGFDFGGLSPDAKAVVSAAAAEASLAAGQVELGADDFGDDSEDSSGLDSVDAEDVDPA